MNKALILLSALLCVTLLQPASAAPAETAWKNLFASMETTDLSFEAFDARIFSERPTMLHLWSGGCGLCAGELPCLEKISRENAGKLNVVGVLLDAINPDALSADEGALAVARETLEDAGADYPNIIGSPELYALMTSCGVSAVPAIWFVDTDGNVLYQAIGTMGEEGYRQAIDAVFP